MNSLYACVSGINQWICNNFLKVNEWKKRNDSDKALGNEGEGEIKAR